MCSGAGPRGGTLVGVRSARSGRVALAALLLAACSTTGDAAPDGSTATDVATSPGALALTARVYQSRMDVDDRQVQVRLVNDGPDDVTVERLALTSTGFAGEMVYRKSGSVVGAGRTVDMPVVLGEPVCDDGSAAITHTALVDYRLPDGTTGRAELPATDEHGQIAHLHEGECFAQDVATVATLEVGDAPRAVQVGELVAIELDLVVAGTGGADHDLRLRHVAGTTLLTHADPGDLEPIPPGRELDVEVPRTGSTTVTLTLLPSRCDAHAIADDKQGTRFRVSAELDGRQGVVAVASPPAVQTALYDLVRASCATLPNDFRP